MNILVVDDEKEIADLIELYLNNEGYKVLKYYSSEEALDALSYNDIDMAILDVMMPGIDGLAMCRIIRQNYNFPIIMVTAKVEDIDKINGLAIGADDYITKPFNTLELIARVKAQIRRYTRYNDKLKTDDAYEIRGLTINKKNHRCFLYDEEIYLTPTEFNIMLLLMENIGSVVSVEDLFEKVWGEEYIDSTNTVSVHIRRLREKLKEPPRKPRFIKTVWGVGYKID